MVKENTLEFSGEVVELLKNAMFKVRLSNGHTILCHSAGAFVRTGSVYYRVNSVKVSVGPYDLQRGIIIYEDNDISYLLPVAQVVEQSPEKACVGG